jgi:hypothetical protein
VLKTDSRLSVPIAQAISRRLGCDSRSSQCDSWWTKWKWGRFTPSTSVSPAKSHSTKCSIYAIPSRAVKKRTYKVDSSFTAPHGGGGTLRHCSKKAEPQRCLRHGIRRIRRSQWPCGLVFTRSNDGIVGSNPTLRGMDVCVVCRLRPCDGLIPFPRPNKGL